jgi:hypothetical protein
MVPSGKSMPGLDMTGSQLDSFSPPSVATSVLRQEAERLLLVYTRERDEERKPKHPGKTGSSSEAHGVAPFWGAPGDLLRKPGSQATVGEMEELHAELRSLEVDVDRKLMLICFENQRWDELLDRYLEFVQVAPENSYVLTWAPNALDCARLCSRTKEVRDALENVIRFHGQTKIAVRLAEVLAQGRADDARLFTLNGR